MHWCACDGWVARGGARGAGGDSGVPLCAGAGRAARRRGVVGRNSMAQGTAAVCTCSSRSAAPSSCTPGPGPTQHQEQKELCSMPLLCCAKAHLPGSRNQRERKQGCLGSPPTLPAPGQPRPPPRPRPPRPPLQHCQPAAPPSPPPSESPQRSPGGHMASWGCAARGPPPRAQRPRRAALPAARGRAPGACRCPGP